MYCGHCGAKLKDGVKFCPNCGAKVPEHTQPVNSSADKEETAQAPQIQAENSGQAAGQSQEVSEGYTQPTITPQYQSSQAYTGTTTETTAQQYTSAPNPGSVPPQVNVPQSDTSYTAAAVAQPSKNNSRLIVIIAAVVVVAIIAAVVFAVTSRGGKTINIDDYLIIEVTGTNGNGIAQYSIDWTAMENDYKDKIDYNDTVREIMSQTTDRDIAKFYLYNQIPDVVLDYISDEDRDTITYDELYKATCIILGAIKERDAYDVADEINKLNGYRITNGQKIEEWVESRWEVYSPIIMFEWHYRPYGSFDKKSNLSNGDKITYTWQQSYDLGKLFNYSYKCKDVKYTVSGLEEGPAISEAGAKEELADVPEETTAAEVEPETADTETEEETKPEAETEEETETATEETTEEETAEPAPPASNDHIASITATSSLAEYGMVHSPDLMLDGDLATAWCEGVNGYGLGEKVTIRFDDVYTISAIGINAGYQKSQDLYEKNSRPHEIVIGFSDGSSEIFDLDDYNGRTYLYLSEPIESDLVTITISSVYQGSKYQDTLISEIEFLEGD